MDFDTAMEGADLRDTEHGDFVIAKWGGPNQHTGGVHWDLWHRPSGRKIESFKRLRDARHMAAGLANVAGEVAELAQHGLPRERRRELTPIVNEAYLQARRSLP